LQLGFDHGLVDTQALGQRGLAQLTGTNEHEGRELQRRARDRHASVAFDRLQQLSDPHARPVAMAWQEKTAKYFIYLAAS
jgi:hypothetical protein